MKDIDERRCVSRIKTMNTTEAVFGINGEKVGVLVKEGAEWVAYNLSDIEVYRGNCANTACWTLQDRL
jgi:hypothetical protein